LFLLVVGQLALLDFRKLYVLRDWNQFKSPAVMRKTSATGKEIGREEQIGIPASQARLNSDLYGAG